jgi:hypothetical protein
MRWHSGRSVVQLVMAVGAQADQIGLLISTLPTAQFFVVELQIQFGAADLACPIVSFQYLAAHLLV